MVYILYVYYTSLLSSERRHSSLSYSRLREMLLEKISSLGVDPKSFGMHSVWAGGATAAANARVPDRLFKRHGRWKSVSEGWVCKGLCREPLRRF